MSTPARDYPYLAVRDGNGMVFKRYKDARDHARKVEGFVFLRDDDPRQNTLLAMFPEDNPKEGVA
jgi:hypothetical protein